MINDSGHITNLADNSLFARNIVLAKRIKSLSSYFAYAVIIISIVALGGWQFNIEVLKRPISHLVAMNPLSAVLFLLCGISFLVLTEQRIKPGKRVWGKIIALLALLLGLIRFVSAVSGPDINVDTFLFKSRLAEGLGENISNRMAANTALSFILSAIALLLLNVETKRKKMPAQIIAVILFLLSLLFLIGYLYEVRASYGILVYLPMAFHTSICFLLFSLTILFANPSRGIMLQLTSSYGGSSAGRLLITVSIIVPVLLGFVRVQVASLGLIPFQLGTALLILAIIVIFIGLSWFIVLSLNNRDFQKQLADQALQESEEQIQTIFNAAPDAVIVIDDSGKIVKWNSKAEALFGWTEKEVKGKTLNETIIPERFRLMHDNGLDHFLQTGEGPILGSVIETYACKKNNDEFEVALNIASTQKTDGHYLFIGFVRDITDRKRSEEKFKGLLEAAPDAMIIANDKGEIVLINRQTEKLFGYRKEELIGKPVEILIPADFRHKHVSQRTQYTEAPKVRAMGAGLELFAVRKDGIQFPVEISLSPLETEEGTLISASVRDITARKKSEEKFKGLLEAAPDAMVIVNEKGKIVLINKQTEKLFAYTKEELIGKPVEILIPAAFRDKHANYRTQYMESPKVRSMGVGLELFAVRKDGTQIPVEISLSPVVTEEGTLISASVRDITERKKSEERIRFLASIADNIQDPVISSDNDFRITRWNLAAEKLLGWKNDEVIGKATTEILKIVYPAETPEQIQKSFRERDFWQGEVIYHTKSGKKINVLTTTSHLKDAIGNVTGNLVLARDITERKKIEAALSKLNEELEERVKERTEEIYKNEQRFRNTLENMLEGIQIIGFDWKYIYVNDAMARHGKYSKEEFIGHTVMEKYPGIEQTEIFKVYQRCLNERVSIHLENEFTFPDKTKGWFELSFQPVPEGLFILSVDITDRKIAEEKIITLNKELEERVIQRTEQLKKSNEELEAFSYSVSHDLRAPLRGIIGFTSILEEDYTSKLDDEGKRITAIIKKNTSKMGQLIDDLLAFSRMGRQELIKATVDINKMVGDIIADQSLNNEKTKWIIHSLPNAIADINTLQQVWVNLISNAVKYSRNAESPKIEIGAIEENYSTTFFVKDNGVGFNEKYKSKLFKVFQRLHTNEEFEGTGIGLAIVEKIVSKHGGKVWAESGLIQGAAFYFSLPIVPERMVT